MPTSVKVVMQDRHIVQLVINDLCCIRLTGRRFGELGFDGPLEPRRILHRGPVGVEAVPPRGQHVFTFASYASALMVGCLHAA